MFPQPEPQPAPWAQRAEEAELYKPAAAQSAAQSCAATESAAQPARTLTVVAQLLALALKHEMKLETELAMKPPTQKPEARLAQTAPQAALAESQPPEAQPPAARLARESPSEAQQPAITPAAQRLCSQLEPA